MSKKAKPACLSCGSTWLMPDFRPCRDGEYDLFILCKSCRSESPKLHLPANLLGHMLSRPKELQHRLMHDWKEQQEEVPHA